ncbi:hydroxymethylglutaryl-CoA lyase [Enterocloster bolteae]|uniref:hydroxymethylglutaryl-CoA lyase n=1 Tax=Enterocloster bolteae TaxID=208479 RepID=UPI00210ED618|nr:hydroxymethylglutaryl-CoA lyase [Enterocloster bolteae]MCQ5146040.1 hydroxymethylglutaryl-CoA lyase [Enterocloster bolteae]
MMMPGDITVVEVGPRDGFQNVKAMIPTDEKIAIIRAMISSGIRQMEITSFVNPKWLPQMADAAQVTAEILKDAPEDFRAIALAPNKRGVSNAVQAGLKSVTYVLSASESHNIKNVNRSVSESLEELRDIKDSFRDINVRVSLATSFGCPFEGRIPQERVMDVVERIHEAGIREIILCDTIGIANPLQIRNTVGLALRRFPDVKFGLHIHDTRGMGLAGIYAGLLEGIHIFETSIGGLGGCPFAPGSAGNTATEDMLNMVNAMGIDHHIDMERYLEAVELVRGKVDASLTGRISNMCQAGA